MSSLEQRLLADLAPQQRSTAEAILARSESDTVPAQALEMALALIHVRADNAIACLLSVLARTVVFVLLKDPDNWNTVLILDDDNQAPYLGVFSSEAQAEIARQDYGASYQSTPIDVALLCRSLHGALGLAINPHDDVLAFEIAPDIFEHFRQSLRDRSQPVLGRLYSVLAGTSGYHAVRVDNATPNLLRLTWIETGWPMRPETIDGEVFNEQPSEPCEVSPKAFQEWLPLSVE